MVEVVRGIRYRSPGDKIFGGPIRPVPERIGPAVARNGARRETPPGSSRWEALIFRASYKIPHRPGGPPMSAKRQTPIRRGVRPRNITFRKKLSRQPQINALRVQHAFIVHVAEHNHKRAFLDLVPLTGLSKLGPLGRA